jgi:hypothetical protein
LNPTAPAASSPAQTAVRARAASSDAPISTGAPKVSGISMACSCSDHGATIAATPPSTAAIQFPVSRSTAVATSPPVTRFTSDSSTRAPSIESHTARIAAPA